MSAKSQFGYVTRGEFLRLAAVAGATLAWGRPLGAQEGMITRPIPSSGETLPVIGLSTWRTFNVGQGLEVRAKRRDVLRLTLDQGGKVIDSSPLYGRAEQVLGDLLLELGAQSEVFLSTKISVDDPDRAVRGLERSLQQLRAERVDLVQVQDLLNWRANLPVLRSWKDEGKIRYIGVTHHAVEGLDGIAEAIESETLDFVQLIYSISLPAAADRVLPLAADKGVAVIVGRPFVGGAVFDSLRHDPLPEWATEFDCASWAQFFLKFILSHPAVTCVTPATIRTEHVLDNMAAGRGRLPDAKQRKKMLAYWNERT